MILLVQAASETLPFVFPTKSFQKVLGFFSCRKVTPTSFGFYFKIVSIKTSGALVTQATLHERPLTHCTYVYSKPKRNTLKGGKIDRDLDRSSFVRQSISCEKIYLAGSTKRSIQKPYTEHLTRHIP